MEQQQRQQQTKSVANRDKRQQQASSSASATNKNQKQSPSNANGQLQHLDPIRSIANVLNHHHLEQQKQHQQQNSARQLGGSVKNDTSNSVLSSGSSGSSGQVAAHSQTLQEEESAAGELRRQKLGLKVVKQQVDQATDRPLLLKVDNKSALGGGKRKRQQQQPPVAPSSHLAASEPQAPNCNYKPQLGNESESSYRGGQVEQGNSYLYAYNEFITKPPANQIVQVLLSPAAAPDDHHQRQLAAEQHNSKIARHREPELTATNARPDGKRDGETKQLKRLKKKQQQLDNHNKLAADKLVLSRNLQVCLLTGETLTGTSKPAALPINKDSSSNSRATKKSTTTKQTRATNENNNRRTSLTNQEQEAQAHALEDSQPGSSSSQYEEDNSQALEDSPEEEGGREEEEEEDEEEDEEGDTLSFILNRSNLLVARQRQQQTLHEHQNCNLLLLDHAPQQQQPENPNHLRQYLQIEENFNSYKAARRRSRGGAPKGVLVLSNEQRAESLIAQAVDPQASSSTFLAPQSGCLVQGHVQTQAQTQNLSSSSLSSSSSSLAQLTAGQQTAQQQHLNQIQYQQEPAGARTARLQSPRSYLQFLSRFAPSQHLAAHHNQRPEHKMYSQAGQLAGQAGAYYVNGDREQMPASGVNHIHHGAAPQQPSQQHLHHPQLGHHLHHHHLHHQHQPQHHHQHSYPIATSSDSSLGSSGAFASSAMRRTTGWLRNLCSKKCLFISCLLLIVFIFILVISLSAYLNFLISSQKTNLQPLSGRLRVMMESMADSLEEAPPDLLRLARGLSSANATATSRAALLKALNLSTGASSSSMQSLQLFGNKTSPEFLQRQRDFETILRGALDRTQPTFKSYPNHLVKLEVYAFRPVFEPPQSAAPSRTSTTQPNLWVYFRLFLNKRTLQQDSQLMSRRAPDEQLDRQFLPRLTQQTLLNGFEQLITTFGSGGGSSSSSSSSLPLARQSANLASESSLGLNGDESSSSPGINSRRFKQIGGASDSSSPGRRSSRAIAVATAASRAPNGPQNSNQQRQLKSFDEQISRLMHLIEAIDLQSIFVAPEFDLLAQTMPTSGQQPAPSSSQIMSETLRASQPIQITTTTTPASVLASGVNGGEYETIGQPTLESNNNKLAPPPTTATATATTTSTTDFQPTRKFTMSQSYRENSTRPSVVSSSTARPTTTTPTSGQRENVSAFLVNHQQKPPKSTGGSSASQKPPRQQQNAGQQSMSGTRQQPTGAVVRLVSGQPVVSQNINANDKLLAGGQTSSSNGQVNGLFAPLQKAQQQDQVAPTTQQTRAGQLSASPTSSTTPLSIPELWQNAFNSKPSNGSSATLDLQDEGADLPTSLQVGANSAGRSRLITVTTIGRSPSSGSNRNGSLSTQIGSSSSDASNNQQPPLSSSEWQKISVLDSEVSNTIRAQLNASLNSAESQDKSQGSTLSPPTTTTTRTTSGGGGLSSKPPKVAPHLHLGGSIVSTSVSSGGGSSQKLKQQQAQSSAVLLNRDFAVAAANNQTRGPAAQQQASSNQKAPKLKQKHRPAAGSGGGSNSTSPVANDRKPNSPNSTPKPNGQKPAKLKKVESSAQAQAQQKNQTLSTSPTTNSKGIRIVDDFLASIGSSDASGQSNTNSNTTGRASQQQQQQRQRNEQVLAAPTLPTTIELTRSTTSQPPARTTSSSSEAAKPLRLAAVPSTLTTTTSTERPPTGDNFVMANQQARPGTTSFSGQWRPLSESSSGSSQDFWSTNANKNSTSRPRSPNQNQNQQQQQSRPGSHLALIVPTERLPATLNQATGSQSPFAMPNAMAVMQPNHQQQQLANRFRANPGSHQRTTPPTNDFESHRVSRMHQQLAHREHNQLDPFGASSSSTTTTSSLAVESSATSSTGLPPANMRIVDDFIVTTDRNDGQSGRATTLLPPLVLSGLHNSALMAQQQQQGRPIISLVVPQGPKRTRGPFAFETLRAFAGDTSTPGSAATTELSATSMESISTPSEPVQPDAFSGFDVTDSADSQSGLNVRAERSSAERNAAANRDLQSELPLEQEKLLIRKRLFLDGGESSEVSSIETSTNQGENEQGDLGFAPSTNSPLLQLDELEHPGGQVLGQHDLTRRAGRFGHRKLMSMAHQPNRCQYFGCKSKTKTNEFLCLNSSQICDDSIDCLDESDELDCVSLLKPDPKTQRMGFSNGAGVVYLNRRGSLAPMCLDYDTTKPSAELIRQINTIGQYACQLQSFARLVSVKINHHDLVDGMNQIRTSRVFHQLTVVDEDAQRDQVADQDQDHQGRIRQATGQQHKSDGLLSTSFASAAPTGRRYHVAISSSSQCPSQQTVFVKCGGFECGQDEFDASAASQQQQETNSNRRQQSTGAATRRKSAADMSDFPWLVKLYHADALACHGYLIDESWLLAARECFKSDSILGLYSNNSNYNETNSSQSLELAHGWTAEISYEHYGLDDYKSIESNRRAVVEVLAQRPSLSIVLAKLERPVRFSPLNRPICLPLEAPRRNFNTSTADKLLPDLEGATEDQHQPETDTTTKSNNLSKYRNCVTANLNLATRISRAVAPPTQQPTADLVLNKVDLSRAEDCFQSSSQPHEAGELAKGLICANELGPFATSTTPSSGNEAATETDTTRVLICSSQSNGDGVAGTRLRSRWTVVGVQYKQGRGVVTINSLGRRRQLFTSIASQIDWIVDTTNPPKSTTSFSVDEDMTSLRLNLHQFGSGNNSDGRQQQLNNSTNTSLALHQLGLLNSNSNSQQPQTNELNPLFNNNQQQQQTCNRFKCSSGECVSWSRICDGLYDCSSHDDEKDCHK